MGNPDGGAMMMNTLVLLVAGLAGCMAIAAAITAGALGLALLLKREPGIKEA
jgi:hypothetical protein